MDEKNNTPFQSDDPTGRGDYGNVVDPLLEQMRSVLRLGPQSSTTNRRRERRFSDADLEIAAPSTMSVPIAVRSRDGSRWLPAPAEQSHRVGLGDASSTKPEPPPSRPLEQHICNTQTCAVVRALATTELLELILSFLETKDVLSLRQTSRHWNSTVQASPQLRLHFFTYAQWCRPGAQFQLLPLSVPGLTIELGKEIHLGQWVIVSLTPEAARRISPEPRPNKRVRSRSIFEGLRGGLGSRTQKTSDAWPASKPTPTSSSTLQYEELFITQPPIMGMQAFIIYPHATADETESNRRRWATESEARALACAKLSSAAGVTLGFLAETTRTLLEEQNSGPSNVEDARVVYKAIMSFCAPEETPRRKRRDSRTVTRI